MTVWPEDLRAKLAALSDRELVAVISDAMDRFDVGLLAEATAVMAERKKAA